MPGLFTYGGFMDDKIQNQIDQIVEDEVRRGFKVLDVPKELQAIMTADRELDSALPVITQVRFTKLTPRKRRLINEAVVKRYHTDLQNKELLSMEQLRRLNTERGEWSDAQDRRIEELQEETGRMARDILAHGHNEDELLRRLVELSEQYEALVVDATLGDSPKLTEQQAEQCRERFHRWYLFDPTEQAAWDQKYAVLQGKEHYSPDDDYQFLTTTVPNTAVLDVLSEAEELRDVLNKLKEMLRKRRELSELQLKQARMYTNCVEQRRDQTEEYARVFYTTERLEGGKPFPVVKTLDDLWSLPEEVVAWLLTESYFFLNGIPDSVRPYLEQLGFLAAPRQDTSETGLEQPSDESPAEPASKPDSSLPTETLVGSSA